MIEPSPRNVRTAVPTNGTSPPVPRPPSDASPSKWVILVVDDEADVLESFRELLQEALPESEVRTAGSGLEALTMLDLADLVVADYRMPEMDGIGLLARCKKLRPQAKRILVTAFPGPVPELENRARREADVAAFVSKGLGPQALVAAVLGVLLPTDVAHPEDLKA